MTRSPYRSWLVAGLLTTVYPVYAAQTETAPAHPSTVTIDSEQPSKASDLFRPHWPHAGMRMHRDGAGLAMMGLLHHLDLTATQQAQILALCDKANADQRSAMTHPRMSPWTLFKVTPNTPDYTAAILAQKQAAADRIDREAALWSQVYERLTPAQQAEIPRLIDRWERHHGHEGHHGLARDHQPGTPGVAAETPPSMSGPL